MYNMVNKKQQLGQFFTKNSDEILRYFSKYIKYKEVYDPFAGSGDLLNWALENGAKKVLGYDVDESYVDNKYIFYNDSLLSPKEYKFVITNPPYLNVNKANKIIKERYFKKFEFEDLYQVSLYSIMNSNEGIIIVPINFLSANNSRKIRKIFFDKFEIKEMNYFKYQVFPDTTYNVISFYYKKKRKNIEKFSIKTHIFPENKTINVLLEKRFNWSIGGEFLSRINKEINFLKIRRLTKKDIDSSKGNIELSAAYNHVKDKIKIKINEDLYSFIKSNIILLKAIDSGSEKGKIALENINKYGVDCLVSKESSRHMIYLMFENKISVSHQKQIINIFNSEIEKMRDNYLSLFLTNYRDNDRKRISFNFVYKFINYIYFNQINNNKQISFANIFNI